MKRLVLILLVVALASAVIFSGCPSPETTTPPETTAPPETTTPQKVFKLKYASPYQAFEAPTLQGQFFCDYIMEHSGGRIEFETYPGAILASGAEHLELVKSGGADFSTLLPTSFRDVLPFAGGFQCHVHKPLRETIPWMNSLVLDNPETAPIFEKDSTRQNVKLIGYLATAATQGYPCNFLPASCLDDLKGKKLGVLSSEKYQIELGMTPVNTAPEEVYESLSRGVYDAMAIAVSAWGNLKLYEVTKAALLTWTNGSTIMPMLVVNLDTWNSLPPDLQQVFMDALAPSVEYSITLVEQMEAEALQTFRDHGLEVNTLSPEEQAIFYKLQFDEWEKDFQKLCEQRGVWDEGQVIVKWTKEYAYPK